MNKQSNYQPAFTSRVILENFQQKGVMRKSPSIFGQSIGASSAEKMLSAFGSAALTVPEHNLFGLPVSGFIRSEKPNESKAKQAPVIRLPKRSRKALPLAA